jgi:hypothetical protein
VTKSSQQKSHPIAKVLSLRIPTTQGGEKYASYPTRVPQFQMQWQQKANQTQGNKGNSILQIL